MKLTRRDLLKLRRPLTGSLALLALAGLLTWSSLQDRQQAWHENTAAGASKNQIEQRLRQVRTEEKEIKEKTLLFQQMQNSGMTGEEKRLDWTEMLRQIQREMHLPGMNYEFGAQTALENVNGAGYAYFSSPMHLQLRLLHEEDLLDFLARIQKEAKAMVLVRSCKLSPLPHANETRDGLAQLGAECQLQWVTVRRSTGNK